MVLKNLQAEQVNTLQKIGKTLRDRREELGHSIETIAEITRISSSMLHSLENAEHEEFTSLIFVRGFLRNYCKFLEIDSDWMIQELNNIYDENDGNLDVKIRYANHDHEQDNERNKQKSYLYVFGIIFSVILILGIGGYFFYNYYLFNPDNIAKTNIIEIKKKTLTDKSQALIEKDPLSVSESRNEELNTSGSRKLNLNIETFKEGWIRIVIDQKQKIEAQLKQGFSYQWKANESINLILASGDLAKILINGTEQYIDPDNQNKLIEFNFLATDF